MNSTHKLLTIAGAPILAILILACGEFDQGMKNVLREYQNYSETIDPTNFDHTMEGEFMLTKAVALAPINDIEYVSHTYEYPDVAGRLVLGEDSFYLYAPLPLGQLIHLEGYFEVVGEELAMKVPYGFSPYINSNGTNLNTGNKYSFVGLDYEWCENTLKLKDFNLWDGSGIFWYLDWQRVQ